MRKFTFIAALLFIYIATATSYTRSFSSPSINSLASDSLAPDSAAQTDSIEAEEECNVPLRERVRRLMENEIFDRTQVGAYIFDLTADTLIYAYGERQCLRPASNEKLITAITALCKLGGSYLYRTSLLATGLPADSVFSGRIFIRAGYDPLFDEEDIKAFADSLVANGIRNITSPIILDLTIKDNNRLGWGWCWDDDTVPLTPLLFRNKDDFVTQLRHAVSMAGIDWDGAITYAETPNTAQTLCNRTHTIDQILLPMMKESDNSMAESLFYQIAAQSGQRGAGRKQAVRIINTLIKEIGLNPDHYQIADGSGLSLYNYLTPELLGKMLRMAWRNDSIYRHLLPSLPIAGHDGTLRKRMKGSAADGNVQAKTGTVEGVSTLSGYLTAANGNRICFSIMNQGIRHTSTGRNFQDSLCKALCR